MASIDLNTASVPVTIRRGDNKTLVYIYKTKATADAVAAPVDLSAWAGLLQVREDEGKTVRFEASTGNGKMALGADGSITVTISAADAAAIKSGSYRYDVELSSGATRKTIVDGSWTVVGDISRGA